MSPELYTEEFRHFKYLKSQAFNVAYYKRIEEQLSKVQPWAEENDPNFKWECRIEFFEQLLDLRWDTVYLVEPGLLYSKEHDKNIFDWEEARLYEIRYPIIYEGQPMAPDEGRLATVEDIPKLEDYYEAIHYHLCTHEFMDGFADREVVQYDNPGQLFRLNENPLIPTDAVSYAAMFYDKAWAQRYQRAITDHLRKNNNAISAISRLF